MFYCWDITIPANTSKEEPHEQWLKVGNGVVTRVDIKFPAGCHGMVKIRLLQEESQKIPLSEDEWVTGDGETVRAETYIELLDVPYKLKLRACSPDTDYDHIITVRIEVEPEEAAGIKRLTELMQLLIDELEIEVPS